MLFISLEFRDKPYNYFKVVIFMKFYFLSFFTHIVILITMFAWDSSSYSEKEREVFVALVGEFNKNTSVPIVKSLPEKPKISNFKKSFSSKSTNKLKTIDTIENNTPVEKEVFIKEENNTPIVQEPKEKNSIIQEEINLPINDLGQNKLIENIGSIPKSENLSKYQETSSTVNTEKLSDKTSDEIQNISQRDSGDFEENGTSFIAKNQDIKGLEYKILKSPNPEYPLMAKKAQLKDEIQIKVRFVVNEKGKIEDIKFYDKQEKFGFHEEVIKTLEEWQFSPINHMGKAVKMYFYKVFIFKINH